MEPQSNFSRLCEKFGANNSRQRMELRDDLLQAVWRLADTVNDDVCRAFVRMHAAGEFQQDAAMEAVVNGWRRGANGKLPIDEAKRLRDPGWFEHNAPDANDVAMNALYKAVVDLRESRESEDARRKALRKRSKSLSGAGYRKMWVNPDHMKKLAGFLSSANKESFRIKMEDGVVCVEEVQGGQNE